MASLYSGDVAAPPLADVAPECLAVAYELMRKYHFETALSGDELLLAKLPHLIDFMYEPMRALRAQRIDLNVWSVCMMHRLEGWSRLLVTIDAVRSAFSPALVHEFELLPHVAAMMYDVRRKDAAATAARNARLRSV